MCEASAHKRTKQDFGLYMFKLFASLEASQNPHWSSIFECGKKRSQPLIVEHWGPVVHVLEPQPTLEETGESQFDPPFLGEEQTAKPKSEGFGRGSDKGRFLKHPRLGWFGLVKANKNCGS